MKYNDLQKIILSLRGEYEIMLNGTEPILNCEYLKAYKLIKQDYILTNGLALINDSRLKAVLKENGITKISISYHFDIHAEISQVKKEAKSIKNKNSQR